MKTEEAEPNGRELIINTYQSLAIKILLQVVAKG
jgi:hypothetical protein